MTEKDRARELFLQGYNCSQSVFAAFSHRFGIDEETALKISAGLGGGIGRLREVCGAVSGSAMAIGSIVSATKGDDGESKKRNYELVREFADRFTSLHGSIVCRDLLKLGIKAEASATPDGRTADYYKNRPCLKVVEDAAEILMRLIEENSDEKK